MNQRLQKKCFIASAGFHLTLLVILFVGPAFLSSSSKSDNNRPMIDFVPLKTIDEAFSGGGNPNGGAPPPPPPVRPEVQPPSPAPREQKQEKAEPVKTPERDPDAVSVKPAKKLPDVSRSLSKTVVRTKNSTAKANRTDDSEARAEAQQRQRQQALANSLKGAASSIREGVSGSTTIELKGPGGGGVPYANFLDALKKIYTDAWIVPDGVADDDSTATASVTIAKDGDVVSAKLIRSSGNSEIDRSVEMTLNRVRHAVPLPDSAAESQRSVTIKFNARVKRGLG